MEQTAAPPWPCGHQIATPPSGYIKNVYNRSWTENDDKNRHIRQPNGAFYENNPFTDRPFFPDDDGM